MKLSEMLLLVVFIFTSFFLLKEIDEYKYKLKRQEYCLNALDSVNKVLYGKLDTLTSNYYMVNKNNKKLLSKLNIK